MVPGLSEADFMARQRYLQLTRRPAAQYSVLSLQDSRGSISKGLDVSRFIREQRKILKTICAQPWPMHVKVAAVKHYRQAVGRYTTLLDTIDTVKDRSMQLNNLAKMKLIQLRNTLTIWNSLIKRIEGKFGSSVASYFVFLRWLCALNLIMSMLMFLFIILPQASAGHGLQVPPDVRHNSSAVSFIFDGQGYSFEYSVLFYGYYDSGQNEPYLPPPNNPNPSIGWNYKLPLAYIIMIPLTFGLCIVAILISVADKYKLVQRADAADPYPFARRVFTGWDYAVTFADTARRKALHIATEFKEMSAEVLREEKKQISFSKVSARIIMNIIILTLLGITCYSIYLVVENVERRDVMDNNFVEAIKRGIDGVWYLILSFQLQIVIIGRTLVMRLVFLIAELVEGHHPRTALKLMLIRMFLLYVSSLYVLIIALLTINCKDDSGREICCWETIVGQELYKLSWSQMGAEILSVFFIDGIVWIAASYGPQKLKNYIDRLEFNVAESVLQLIYSQGLVWLGVLFCPLLYTINTFKYVVLFYIRLIGVILFNKPPKAMFKISSTNNFYLGMLLLMQFLTFFPVGYAVLEITPSTTCGPYRGLSKMMDIVTNELASWPTVLQNAIAYLRTTAVIVPLIILLCIVIYYYGALSHVLKEINKDLKIQLLLERRGTTGHRVTQNSSHHSIEQDNQPRASIRNGISSATFSVCSLQSLHNYMHIRNNLPSIVIENNANQSMYPASALSNSTMNTSSVSDFIYVSTSENILPWSESNQNNALPTGTVRQNF